MSDNQIYFGSTLISIWQGDITRQDVDAIVNAANSRLMGGGGVDGAIHKAGGSDISRECGIIRKSIGKCKPGEAVITGGGKLKAPFVIHAVGPVWRGGLCFEDDTLANSYQNSLKLAVENDLKTIAFPSISTGAYGFPFERASHIAISTTRQFCLNNMSLEEVRFVLFDLKSYECFKTYLEA